VLRQQKAYQQGGVARVRATASVRYGDTPDCAGIDVRNWHEGEAEGGAKPVLLCPRSSDVNLFSYGQGIIDFDAEMPDGALDLCMSQQQLHRT
jgi:hypothetical protein